MQVRFRLDLDSAQVRENLLPGLDSWVRLGLLSESQVKEIALALSEDLSVAPASQVDQSTPGRGASVIDDFITSGSPPVPAGARSSKPESAGRREATPSPPARTSPLSRAIQSLLSEISVVWLLFLGVFLVVVSSAVLAASQWQSFSAVGQYAILFAYTLAFLGASFWTGQKEQLQTTAKMLSLATALLIPINFWMMDALNVFGSIAGIGFGILAAVILSLIGFRLLETRLNRVNLVGLSWLHLGWMASGVGFWPVAATYLGTVGSAVNLFVRDRRAIAPPATQDSSLSEVSTSSSKQASVTRFSFDTLTVAIAITILLFRSLFIAQVPASQLGLAAGICGGLVAWLARTKPSRGFWDVAGFGLMLLGWAVSRSETPPWQAVGVSAIALWIIWDRLRHTWKSSYLFAFVGIACQTYILLWFMLPFAFREGLLQTLARIPRGPSDSIVWASLGLFPVVLCLLLLSRQLRRWQQSALGEQAELIALAVGTSLACLSLLSSFTAAANLTASTLALIAVGRRRQSIEIATLTHAVGLIAIAASIYYFEPGLRVQAWTLISLGFGCAELLVHLFIRSDRWRRNFWFGGIGLLAIAYGLLATRYYQQPNWLWLPVPILFSIIANHRRVLRPKAAVALASAAFVLQSPWIFLGWATAIFNFAIATVCAGLNARIWRSPLATLFAVGEAIALVNSIALYGLSRLPNSDPGWLLVIWAVQIWALWLIPRLISRRSSLLGELYQKSCMRWSFAFLALFALVETLFITFPFGNQAIGSLPIFAAILLAAALVENIHYRPAEWKYWSLGWTVGIILILVLVDIEANNSAIAIAFLALAFFAQMAGNLWVKRHPTYRLSWHGIPLVYAVIGAWIGHVDFSVENGFYTIAMAALFINVGRRVDSFSPLRLLGLFAFSAGAYELLVYQLSQASGGSPGDGITLLAALTVAIAFLEKWLSPWLQKYVKLPLSTVQKTAHLHWAFGSLLSALAFANGLSQPVGTLLWTTIVLLLSAYALSVGNRRWTPQTHIGNHLSWTSVGLLEVLLCLAFSRFELFFDRATLLVWAAVIASLASAVVYSLPWERWGWPIRPFRLLGTWLPLLAVGTTLLQIKIPGLLAVSAFYAWLAQTARRIRLSYLSIFLIDWALLRYLNDLSLLTELGLAIIVGLSVLYVAQVDPYFRNIEQRQQRHILRVLASVAIALTALYQAEVFEPMLLYAGVTIILCLIFIFAGLTLKIRAFLYVGTLTFVVQIVRVLWLFISTYSLLLWAVGIVLGLMFIWIAATFESRRSQVAQLLDTWTAALDTWD